MPLFESLDAIAIAQPTASNRRAVARFAAGAERYLNRGLRPLPGYSPYPGDRSASTQTWFDDNGWWGLAFVNAYRATGTRRWLADAERALAYIAAAGWDPQEGDLVEHEPPLQGRRGARLGHAPGDAALPADPLRLRPRPGPQVPGLGEHHRVQRADGLYAASNVSATPIDYIEAPLIYAQALLCQLTATPAECERRAPEGHRARPLRLPARLLPAVRRDLPAVDARAVLARPRPVLYALAADNARDAQTRALNGEGLYLLSWNGQTLAPDYARPGMLQTQAATTSLFAWLAVYPAAGGRSLAVRSDRLGCRPMVPRVGMLSIAARTGAVLAVIVALAGCGSSAPSNATARADPRPMPPRPAGPAAARGR